MLRDGFTRDVLFPWARHDALAEAHTQAPKSSPQEVCDPLKCGCFAIKDKFCGVFKPSMCQVLVCCEVRTLTSSRNSRTILPIQITRCESQSFCTQKFSLGNSKQRRSRVLWLLDSGFRKCSKICRGKKVSRDFDLEFSFHFSVDFTPLLQCLMLMR